MDIALKEDDTQNRTASVLYAFVRVALCSPVCRKMALFQLFNYNQLDSIEITEKVGVCVCVCVCVCGFLFCVEFDVRRLMITLFNTKCCILY